MQLVESRSLCEKPNENQKQDRETATAGLSFKSPRYQNRALSSGNIPSRLMLQKPG